jgi:hypothetical protein
MVVELAGPAEPGRPWVCTRSVLTSSTRATRLGSADRGDRMSLGPCHCTPGMWSRGLGRARTEGRAAAAGAQLPTEGVARAAESSPPFPRWPHARSEPPDQPAIYAQGPPPSGARAEAPGQRGGGGGGGGGGAAAAARPQQAAAAARRLGTIWRAARRLQEPRV